MQTSASQNPACSRRWPRDARPRTWVSGVAGARFLSYTARQRSNRFSRSPKPIRTPRIRIARYPSFEQLAQPV